MNLKLQIIQLKFNQINIFNFFLTTYFRIKSYTYIYMQLYNYHENVHLTTTHCYYANTLSSAAVSPHHRATFRD